ncbi:DUF3526 domain-containing protein [Hymenobacter terrenus]|uniref:DUF3526 domain-containing protein n=1 Tax=Hymenobacter terrenus TaxID=1629124 RepID=UPI000619CB16|nr:DUF3526 domain-containing protein [Hymenobacter terrenus]
MFKHIAHFDWLALKASRTLTLTVALTGFLVFFAFWTGGRRVTFQRDTLTAIAQQQRADDVYYAQQIAAIKPGAHFDGGHFGDPTNPFYFGNKMGARYATLPAAPLALTSAGGSDLAPYYYKLTLSKRQALYHSEELENPQVLYNGHFDLSFVLIYLLPLLIIGLTYNVAAADREQGTLALLLAGETPFGRVVAYRYVFRYLLLGLALSVSIVGGLLAFGVNPARAAAETGYLLLVTWLYAAFWFALSFLVNSFGRASGPNAAVLVGLWLAVVLLVPTLLSAWLNRAYPMPSRIALITETREVSDKLAQDKNAVARFYDEHPDLRPATAPPPGDQTVKMLHSRLAVELAMESVLKQFDQRAAERQAQVSRFRFLSPAVFVQQALNDVAGTGDARYQDFEAQVTRYHAAFRAYYAPLVYRQAKFTVRDMQQVPIYRYEQPPTQLLTPTNTENLLYLLAATLGCALLATVRVRKMRLALD